jgi:hypothetical protein
MRECGTAAYHSRIASRTREIDQLQDRLDQFNHVHKIAFEGGSARLISS